MKTPSILPLLTLLLIESVAPVALAQSQSLYSLPVVPDVAAQPLSTFAQRLTRHLEFLGSPLPQKTLQALEDAYDLQNEADVSAEIQAILDPLCIAGVHINPESRVKAQQGPAKPTLYQAETKRFLIKVINEAGVTARLNVAYTGQSEAVQHHHHHGQQTQPSQQDLGLFHIKTYMPGGKWLNAPGIAALNGLEVNYAIVDIYCRDKGKREATLSFDVGQGTQDLGFRSDLPILFDSEPTYQLRLASVSDEDGSSVFAGFVIRDENGQVFPSQSTRVPPDFWFQSQVYRTTGQSIRLPNGNYSILVGRGPEYLLQNKTIEINGSAKDVEIQLQRWVDPSLHGYWSGDHHIHASGCAHYMNPIEGVRPDDMLNHILGEDLKVGSVLTWGPGFDYQKQFFSGKTNENSTYPYTLRYDVEVSGFGSHQSGHLVLLRLKEQMYPGGDSSDHWPTLGLNTLKWAQKQGAVCGPAHSGYGINLYLNELPNYEVPPYDSIGANEYVVDVTHLVEGPNNSMVPAVDFISTGDTWPVAELNMWYHTLNAGYRTRISGETDFPCITGSRVGIWRSYVRLDETLNYDEWCEGISRGSNYVSDGFSHLIDFKVNGLLSGDEDSEVALSKPGKVKVSLNANARLAKQHDHFTSFFLTPDSPWSPTPWSIERAVVDGQVQVEIVVNGKPVATQSIPINQDLREIEFEIDIEESSWVTARIFPSSHTNPVWVVVDEKPVRASRRSIEWLRAGVDKCWESKKQFYHENEMEDAIAAYEHAREAYDKRLTETIAP